MAPVRCLSVPVLVLLLLLVAGPSRCSAACGLDATTQGLLQLVPSCQTYISNASQIQTIPNDTAALLRPLAQAVGLILRIMQTQRRDCTDALTRYWCTQLFRPCNVIAPGVTLPSAPCDSVCGETQQCSLPLSLVLQKINQTALQPLLMPSGCDVPETSPPTSPAVAGQDRWPESAQVWALGPPLGNVSVACAAPPQLPANPRCLFPLANNPRTADAAFDGRHPYCMPACPTPLLPYERPFEIVQTIFGWIGILCAIILLTLRLMDEQLRSYPANLTTFMFVASLLVSVAFCINSITGFSNINCENAVTAASRSKVACAVQASLLYVGAVAGIFLWVAISLHSLLAMIWPEKQLFSRWTMIVTHLLCWGLPIAALVFLLVANAVGSAGHSFCFIRGELDSDGRRSLFVRKWILFSGPVMFALVLGLLVLIGLLINLQRIRADRSAGRMTLRILMFAAVFTILYGMIIVYEFTQTVRAEHNKHQQQAWATCVIRQVVGCKPQHISVPLYWAFVVCIQIQGIALLILFGTTQSMLAAGRKLLCRITGGSSSGEPLAMGGTHTPYISLTVPQQPQQ